MEIPSSKLENNTIPPFSTETKESELGVIVHFANNVYTQIRLGVSISIFAFLGLSKTLNSFYTISVLLLLAFLYFLLAGLFAYYQYKNLIFKIDYDQKEFHIRKGVFHKIDIVFKIDRIQQINIKRNWLQRILGLSSLEIDTAGTNVKEVDLRALSVVHANKLMQTLMHLKSNLFVDTAYDNEISNTEAATEEQSKIWKVGLGNLFKYSLSSNPIKGLALVIIPLNYLYDYFSRSFSQKIEEAGNYADDLGVISIIIFVATLFFLGVVLNIIRIIVRYFGFSFSKKGEELKLSHGLINLRTMSLRPSRIQLVSIQQNMLQKLWSICNYQIKQFEHHKQKDSVILFPALNIAEQDQVDTFLNLKEHDEPLFTLKPHIRYVIYHVFLRILIAIILMGILWYYNDNLLFLLISFMLWIPVSIFWVRNLYKQYYIVLFKDTLIKHSGFWNKKKDILNIYKIQTITIKQYFWQKKRNIGKIVFYTAGGTLSFRFADYKTLINIQKRYLFQLEAFPKKWM